MLQHTPQQLSNLIDRVVRDSSEFREIGPDNDSIRSRAIQPLAQTGRATERARERERERERDSESERESEESE